MAARASATSKSRLLPGAVTFQKVVESCSELGLVPFSWQSFAEKWQVFDRFGDFVDKYPPVLAEFGTLTSGVTERQFQGRKPAFVPRPSTPFPPNLASRVKIQTGRFLAAC